MYNETSYEDNSMAAVRSDFNTDSVEANPHLESERGRQTGAVLLFMFAYFILPLVFVSLWLLLFLTPFYWVSLCYGFWVLYDVYIRKISSRGGRRLNWFRDLKIWHYIRDYFPMSLEKTADLDPNKNYVCGYHPHGVIALGGHVHFLSNATGHQDKFPGIDFYPLGLKSNFQIPVYREILLWTG